LALNRSQPLASARFYAKIEKIAGKRGEAMLQRGPRLDGAIAAIDEKQGAIDL
jgi:hypothetical protein